MAYNQSFLLYTVIVKRSDGRMMFLVENDHKQESEFIFPATASTKAKTGLATVINNLTAILDVDVEGLELFELTNACFQQMSIPLFVFNYEYDADPNELLKDQKNYQWQFSVNFKDTLQKYDISGVPSFNF